MRTGCTHPFSRGTDEIAHKENCHEWNAENRDWRRAGASGYRDGRRGAGPVVGDDVLRHQRRIGQGRRFRRPRQAPTSIARRLPPRRVRAAKTWHAYLSTQASGSTAAVNAKDRIGKGPWQNAKGVVVAKDVAELHGTNNLNKQTALTEKGDVVNGRGDTPNKHDILTGSQPDGTAFAAGEDKTCGNWTKSGEGSAIVGHAIARDSTRARRRCRGIRRMRRRVQRSALVSTGGAGLLYCFAAN